MADLREPQLGQKMLIGLSSRWVVEAIWERTGSGVTAQRWYWI
jgi:hypothetical protein